MKDLAEIAYETYMEEAKKHPEARGAIMVIAMPWETLPEIAKDEWRTVIRAVLDQYNIEMPSQVDDY